METAQMHCVPMRLHLMGQLGISLNHALSVIQLAEIQGIAFVKYYDAYGEERSGIVKRFIPAAGPYQYTFKKLQRDRKPIKEEKTCTQIPVSTVVVHVLVTVQ